MAKCTDSNSDSQPQYRGTFVFFEVLAVCSQNVTNVSIKIIKGVPKFAEEVILI